MEELGMAGPPVVESSVAYHLHPNRPFSCSFQQHLSAYKNGARYCRHFPENVQVWRPAVCSLNVTTLLSAYQAEILEEMGWKDTKTRTCQARPARGAYISLMAERPWQGLVC